MNGGDGWYLPYVRLRLMFSASVPVQLPRHPGSAWRGALGHALRELTCITQRPDCRGCGLMACCVYQQLFESIRPETAGPSLPSHAAHPFVLEILPEPPPAGSVAAVGVQLMGRAIRWLPELTLAMERAGRRGIGHPGNRLQLIGVQQWYCGEWRDIARPGSRFGLEPLPGVGGPALSAIGKEARIRLLSPLRIVCKGQPLQSDELTPWHFMTALYRRIRMLCEATGVAQPPRWPDIDPQARFPDASLHWVELDRKSSRQRRKHPIGGILGSFVLPLDGLEKTWPLLWHGQYLHLGKLTSMGHGAYRLVFEPESAAPLNSVAPGSGGHCRKLADAAQRTRP